MTDYKALKCTKFDFGLQRSPRPLAGFGGHFAAGGGAGLGKRMEREGPKLLLNQGPSEPCYATANTR